MSLISPLSLALCSGAGWGQRVGSTEPMDRENRRTSSLSREPGHVWWHCFWQHFILDGQIAYICIFWTSFPFLIYWSIASMLHHRAQAFNPSALFNLEKRKTLWRRFYCLLFFDSFQLYLIYPRPNKNANFCPVFKRSRIDALLPLSRESKGGNRGCGRDFQGHRFYLWVLLAFRSSPTWLPPVQMSTFKRAKCKPRHWFRLSLSDGW